MADKTRKGLHTVFEQFGLEITAEANLHLVKFLDETVNLATGKYKPYRKPNNDPLCIHKHSNHPPSILGQLPASINKRISTLSSDKQVFDDEDIATSATSWNICHNDKFLSNLRNASSK